MTMTKSHQHHPRIAQIGGDAIAGAFANVHRFGTAVVAAPVDPAVAGRSRTDHRPASERGAYWGDAKPDEETTRQTVARIERERVVPLALKRACLDHGAQVGEACWGTALSKVTGICRERVTRARLEEWATR